MKAMDKPDKPGLYLYLTEISGLPDVLLVDVEIKDGKYRFNPEHSIDYSEESWLETFGSDKFVYLDPILGFIKHFCKKLKEEAG